MESDERQPLLSRPVEGPCRVFGRCLLWLSGWRFACILLLLFLIHLVRHNQIMEWFLLANSTMQTDFFFSLGGVLAVLATSLFAASLFSDEASGLEIHCFFFPFVFLAAATTFWSALLRISQAHDLEVVCFFHRHSQACGTKPMFTGVLELWMWFPRGLLQVAQRTAIRPWAWALGLQGPYSAWQGRELLVGSTFWFFVLVAFMIAPALQAGLNQRHRFHGYWLAFWLGVFLTASATYVVIMLTTEPLLFIWVFFADAIRRPWSSPALPPDGAAKSGGGGGATSRTAEPEERLVLVFLVWFVVRLLYLTVRARFEQWFARQKCEEGLRQALARPFRADLESGFAGNPATKEAHGLPGGSPLGSGLLGSEVPTTADEAPSTASSIGSESTAKSSDASSGEGSTEASDKAPIDDAVGGLLEIDDVVGGLLEEKRAALVAARRSELCDEACGEAALPTYLRVKVRRSHLLEDTWREMVERPICELLAPSIIVEFEAEEGIDTGGLTRDWFDSVGRAVAESAAGPSLLVLAPDGTLMPRPVASLPEGERAEEVDRMRSLLAFGRFTALAVLSARPLPLSLGLVACKYMLRCPVTMDDVRRLDPEFFRGRVEAVLQPGGPAALAELLGSPLTFVAAGSDWQPAAEGEIAQELLSGGAEMEVTEDNKVEYVRLLCEAYLCSGVRREIQCILQGFWDVLPLALLQDFGVGPRELSVLISGIHDIDPEEWYLFSTGSTDHPVYDWFWEVVRKDLNPEERCLLLHFVTGSSRLPPGGFKELQPGFTIDVAPGKATPERLPHAHTCINKLVLECYASRDQLREKLLLALSAEGFTFA